MQEEDADVMQDAGGIDANDGTTVQYNTSPYQAAMLNIAGSHKQDSLPALQSGQICSNVLAAIHLVKLLLATYLIMLHDKLSPATTLHKVACKHILQDCV